MEIIEMRVVDLIPYAGNAKDHPDWQIDQIASSIEEFGNCDPIAVWHNEQGEPEVVEGHGRLMALKRLGIAEAPVIVLDHLTDEQRRAYTLVHNQLTMSSGFDFAILDSEIESMETIDMTRYGFETDPPELSYSNTSREIDVSDFADEHFDHQCEACGFRFNDERA